MVITAWVALSLLVTGVVLVREYPAHASDNCHCAPGRACSCPAALDVSLTWEQQFGLVLLLGGLALLLCGLGVTLALVAVKATRRRVESGSPRREGPD
ncbi:MAG: hypothetical protein L3K18_07645 [Thermoplasmata archaeon]|nr:hypothetical protein [Thermoplasmata archaeon]